MIYARVIARGGHPASTAPAVLTNVVRNMATTQATIDTFVGVAAFSVLGLVLLILVLPAQPPRSAASHEPFFRRKLPE